MFLIALVALSLCVGTAAAQPPPNCTPILDEDQFETPTGLPVAWAPEDIPVSYYINPEHYPASAWDPEFELVRDAFGIWQRETLGALVFCYAGTTDATGFRTDFQNTISFGDVEGEVACPNVAKASVTASSATFTNASGVTLSKIVDADIIFNDTQEGFFVWGTDTDLAACEPSGQPSCSERRGPHRVAEIGRTAVHEIGHFLGLDHSAGTVMDANTPYCDVLGGQMTGADITCLQYLYPPPSGLPPLVVSCPLTLSPNSNAVGEQFTATTTVVNTTGTHMTIETLAVTGRHADGSVWDFSFHENVVIEPGGQHAYEETRSLGLPGAYTFEVSHRIGVTWHQTPPLEGVDPTATVSVNPTQPFFAGVHNQAGNHHIYIYPSLGDGTFQQEERIADFDGGVAEIRALSVADFNHDGLLDVFAALADRRCFYLRNEGAIVFTPIEITTLSHGVPIGCTAAGDFTGDGYADVLIAAGNGANQTFYLLEHLDTTPVVTATAVPGPSHDAGNLDNKVVDADYVDSNTLLDVVVSFYRDENTQPIRLYGGNGDGTFQPAIIVTDNPPGPSGSVALTLGDFTRDGIVDLIVGMDNDGDAGQAWGTPGNGDGTFTLQWMEVFDVNNAGHCDAFDFNRDGWLDVVGVAGNQPGRLFLGEAPLTFSAPSTIYAAMGARGRLSAPERAPVGPTPAGTHVITYLASYAIAAFDSVGLPGATSLTLEQPVNGPPGQTSLAVLGIATTATLPDSVSLTFPYAQHLLAAPGVGEATLRLYQDPGTGWVEVPSILDLSAQLLHTRVAGLSSFAIVGDVVTAAPPGTETPGPFALRQNAPNPFNPTTTIHFILSETRTVSLRIYDLRGRLVRTLLNASRMSGPHALTWDGRDDSGVPVSSGVYIARLHADGQVEARKLALIR